MAGKVHRPGFRSEAPRFGTRLIDLKLAGARGHGPVLSIGCSPMDFDVKFDRLAELDAGTAKLTRITIVVDLHVGGT